MKPATRPRERRLGRPPVDKSQTIFGKSAMHGVLMKRLVGSDLVIGDKINVPEISRKIGCAKYTVYRWVNGDKISPRGAKEMVQISGGRLKLDDLIPFILG